LATVEQVWRAVFPAARALGEDSARQRQVAWVRVLKARTPAFDALDREDMALLPHTALASLAGLGLDERQLVEAVAEAGASGVVAIGAHPLSDRAAEVAARAGLAAFVLPETDVAALERSALAFIINARAELEARAAELERQLEQQVLAGTGADGLAATIARFLARPVAIEAADASLLALHAPPDAAEVAPWLTEYLRRRRGAALRVTLPAPGAAGDGGTGASRWASSALVLLGPAAPSELERVCCARLAPFLGLALGALHRAEIAPRGPGRRTEDRLPSGGPPWVVVVARQLDEAAPRSLAERERVRDQLRRLEPPRRLALRGDASSLELRLVAAVAPDDVTGQGLAARVSRQLGRPVALSTPFSADTERAVREAQARATLEAFEALPPAERNAAEDGSGATVARAELLPAYQLLAGLSGVHDGARHARELLAPVLSGRRLRDGQALATLRAVIDHGGMAEAAAALGIHRNTLAYRLAGLERRTGWRLSDPLLRFALALAVRLVQSDQNMGEDGAEAGRRRRVGRR